MALVDDFLAADFETLKQKRKFAVYAALTRACEARGVKAPSYKSFTAAANRRPRQEQVAKRQGPRAAAQAAPFYWELSLTTPRHGDRPFEVGHLDHTQLDVELVCSRTGRNLGRPWSTFLSDAYSRRLLAVCLTFDPPSYRACMLALRECVRRYQRLPETMVVDGGPEFESVYFETLLARYGCAKKTRPGGRPLRVSMRAVVRHNEHALRAHVGRQHPTRATPGQGDQRRQSESAGWLGSSPTNGATDEEMLVIEDAVRSHAWIFHGMGELIGAAPTLARHPRREHLVRAIEAAFRRVAVNPRVWTRRLGLARGTVLLWRKGRTLPSLWCQLVVSSELGISPLQLLYDRSHVSAPHRMVGPGNPYPAQ